MNAGRMNAGIKILLCTIGLLLPPLLQAADNPLFISKNTHDFSSNPDLLERVKSSPHGYFRFINIVFSQEVCNRFKEMLITSPSLNLHGDAHLEQYAVTDLGRGLTDFDDSSTGPGLVDIMRFGVSLRLACRQLGWEKESEKLFDTFLDGYQQAGNNPDLVVAEPSWAAQKRAKFKVNRNAYFKWVASIMEPMPESEIEELTEAIKPYIRMMQAEDPNRGASYFDIVAIGYLKMGIGSALDMKYVLRIQGKTTDPMDDIVLEMKEVRDISGIECINAGNKIDPFRVLLGQARIAYTPFNHLGYFFHKDKNFWVHSWVDNYKEIDINKSFENVEMLREIVFDVGVQLGKGHVKHIAAPFDLQLRLQQNECIKNNYDDIKLQCRELEKLTVDAWTLFLQE